MSKLIKGWGGIEKSQRELIVPSPALIIPSPSPLSAKIFNNKLY